MVNHRRSICNEIGQSAFDKAQVQSEGVVWIRYVRRLFHGSGRVAKRKKPGQPPAFCFEAIHRPLIIVAPAWMGHMIGASAQASLVPGVVDVKHQRGMDSNGGMKTFWRLPGSKPDPGHKLACCPRGLQWRFDSIAGHPMPSICHALDPNLKPLKRRIHIADSSAC